jgi:hypothetical protein
MSYILFLTLVCRIARKKEIERAGIARSAGLKNIARYARCSQFTTILYRPNFWVAQFEGASRLGLVDVKISRLSISDCSRRRASVCLARKCIGGTMFHVCMS